MCVFVCTCRREQVVWVCQSAARPTGMAAARDGSTAWFCVGACVSVCDYVWSPASGAAPPAGQDSRPHRAVPTALGPWTANDSDASEERRTKPGWVYTHTHTELIASTVLLLTQALWCTIHNLILVSVFSHSLWLNYISECLHKENIQCVCVCVCSVALTRSWG